MMFSSYRAKLRHAQFYAEAADRANNLYLAGGADMLSGLALFDQERTQIDAGWVWALNQAPNTEIDEILLSYANSTAYIGELRYDIQRIVQLLHAALEATRRLRRPEAESAVLGNLGNAHVIIGE